MIIIGYQGIGKSTLVKKRHDVIDLESSKVCFSNGIRPEKWWEIYCNIAIDLHSQGYKVFTSSHKQVRDYFNNVSNELLNMTDLYAIVPSLDMENAWVNKLEYRYAHSKLEKDYKAYMNAKDRYMDNIMEIINDIKQTYIIQSMNYDLSYVVSNLKNITY